MYGVPHSRVEGISIGESRFTIRTGEPLGNYSYEQVPEAFEFSAFQKWGKEGKDLAGCSRERSGEETFLISEKQNAVFRKHRKSAQTENMLNLSIKSANL